MESDMQRQNEMLKRKICQLELQINRNSRKQGEYKQTHYHPIQKSEQIQADQKTCNSQIDFSPIHTCQSLQQDTISLDMYQKVVDEQMGSTSETKKSLKLQSKQKQLGIVKFDVDVEDVAMEKSSMTHYQTSKQLNGQQIKPKNPRQSNPRLQQFDLKTVYNSAIRQKNICEQCVTKMHQMHETQFLKNKYHKQYICVRTQLEKLKSQLIQHQFHQTPRSSGNFIDMYYDQNNQEKSEKSSFSFQNIENTLLSERFSLEIQEFIKLIDRLLPLDIKFIQLSSGDFKLLLQLQIKIQKLKSHLGLDTQPKYLQELFTELQKSEVSIKKIHQKYRKLIERLAKVHKQKMKKNRDQFSQVNERFVKLLRDLSIAKVKNQKLSSEVQAFHIKTLSYSTDLMQLKSLKDALHNQSNSGKQRDLHDSSHLGLQKSSSLSEIKLQKQVEKYQLKLKNGQKVNRKLQKLVKQLQSQIIYIKKKSQNDLKQFMNSMILHKLLTQKDSTQQRQTLHEHQETPHTQPDHPMSIQDLKRQNSQTNSCIQQISTLVYDIFSFTSCESVEDENVFLPQTPQQIMRMLSHVKKFAQKFDSWQKQKQKQIDEFQKNFLRLLKFFIDNFKFSQEELLQQISKIQDNEPLLVYIKKYYLKTVELSDLSERLSSSFTFGQKSESCKDSQPET